LNQIRVTCLCPTVGRATVPYFNYGGSPVNVPPFPTRRSSDLERISGGYEVALHIPSSDQYIVWGADSSGNVVSNLTGGIVSGTRERLGTRLKCIHQALNDDGSSFISTTSSVASGSTRHIPYRS